MAECNKCWKRLSMKPEIEEEIAVILGYVQTGPVPNGSGPILERFVTDPILDRSDRSIGFYHLSMRRMHVKVFKMGPMFKLRC